MTLIYVSEGVETNARAAATTQKGLQALKVKEPDEGFWSDDEINVGDGQALYFSPVWREWMAVADGNQPDLYVKVSIVD